MMIEYASATHTGVILTTDKGTTRTLLYRHSESYNGSAHPSPEMAPDNWTAAAFIVLSDSDERTITAAIATLPKSDKKLTTSRIALAVQRIERARQNMTKAPKQYSEYYDGTETDVRAEYPRTFEESSLAFSCLRGKRSVSGRRVASHDMRFHPQSVAEMTRKRATQEYSEPRVWYAADADVEWNVIS